MAPVVIKYIKVFNHRVCATLQLHEMEIWWFHSNAWVQCPCTFHLQRVHDQQLYFWMFGPYPVEQYAIGCSSNSLLHMANQSQKYHWRLDLKCSSLHESFFWQFFFHFEIATISHMDLQKKKKNWSNLLLFDILICMSLIPVSPVMSILGRFLALRILTLSFCLVDR